MNSFDRPIAMTDIETSGDIPSIHEILEIGLVVYDQKTFEIIDTLNVKVRPEHIETAVPAALAHNGWKAENWSDALSLKEAMKRYAEKTQNAIFCAYNVSFDWSFILEAFAQSGLQNPMSTRENHDRLDLLTLAYAKGLKKEGSLSLKNACKVFGVPPEPEPHGAFSGAMTAFELWKKIC
jgi:DNA polymerase III epsilon subunit-like protein